MGSLGKTARTGVVGSFGAPFEVIPLSLHDWGRLQVTRGHSRGLDPWQKDVAEWTIWSESRAPSGCYWNRRDRVRLPAPSK